jgi:hypothetical protein
MTNFMNYCELPLMLLDSCQRKCNLLDEIAMYGPLPVGGVHHLNDKLLDKRSEIFGFNDGKWKHDHKVWNYSAPTSLATRYVHSYTIPTPTQIFHCEHCYMLDGKMQLLNGNMLPKNKSQKIMDASKTPQYKPPPVWDSFIHDATNFPLAWSRHSDYFSVHTSSLLSLHPTTIKKIRKYENITKRKDIVMNDEREIEQELPNDKYEKYSLEDPYNFQEYKCSRRFVHPVIHAHVWSLTNVFHIVWDLLVPIVQLLLKYNWLFPQPFHLFLNSGHPFMSPRLHRILRGDFSPAGQSPLHYLLSRITMGIPVHSTTWLEHLPGISCFDFFHAGLPMYKSDPHGHGMYMASEGFEIWSTLSNNRKDMYSSGDVKDEMELLQEPASKNMLVQSVFKQTYMDTLNSRPEYSNQLRSILEVTGIYPNILKMNSVGFSQNDNGTKVDNPYLGKNIVLFVKRKGTRVILNRHDLIEIAKTRIAHIPNFVLMGSVSLEEMPFSEQLLLFQSTSILIAVHGQACANTLFMKGNGQSALLMAMPKDFFGWHYVYANAAISVGVHTVVMMRSDDSPIGGWKGGVDNDRVNNRRDENFNLREDLFEDGFELVLHRVINGLNVKRNEIHGKKEKVAVDVEYIRGEDMLQF